jgi:hypothetical protein
MNALFAGSVEKGLLPHVLSPSSYREGIEDATARVLQAASAVANGLLGEDHCNTLHAPKNTQKLEVYHKIK